MKGDTALMFIFGIVTGLLLICWESYRETVRAVTCEYPMEVENDE